MNVALWYRPPDVSGIASSIRAIRAGANPSMNVALWYGPTAADTLDEVCKASEIVCP
jgi:hypothetical protein